MFSNTTNKQRLQTFLKEEFANLAQTKPAINFVYSVRHTRWNLSSGDRCEEFECHHIEADTIIFFIYSDIRKSGILDPVVIDAEDIDVIVLSAFVRHNTEGLLAIKKEGHYQLQRSVPKGCSRYHRSASHIFRLRHNIWVLRSWQEDCI